MKTRSHRILAAAAVVAACVVTGPVFAVDGAGSSDPAAGSSGCGPLDTLLDVAVPREIADPGHLLSLLKPAALSDVFGNLAIDDMRVLLDDDLLRAVCRSGGLELFGQHPAVPADRCDSIPGIPPTPVDNGSMFQSQRDLGAARYLNRGRLHRAATELKPPPPEPEAVKVLLELAERLGIPPEERESIDVRSLNVAAGAPDEEPTLKAPILRMLTAPRVEGATPVRNSFLRVTLDAESKVAALRLHWPRMVVALDPVTVEPRSRDEVLADVAERLLDDNRCGATAEIEAAVVYAPQVVQPPTDADGATERSTVVFEPMLWIAAVPALQKGFDSDGEETRAFEETEAGQELLVELYTPPARD